MTGEAFVAVWLAVSMVVSSIFCFALTGLICICCASVLFVTSVLLYYFVAFMYILISG